MSQKARKKGRQALREQERLARKGLEKRLTGRKRPLKRLGLEKHVTLTGFRSDVANLLSCSDVVVLSSETESAPLTLLEGMSSGLPVVATRVGGIPEIVEDGVNGLLVQSKNPEAIAEKILELNSDPEMRRRLGEAARETVLERYTAEKIVGRYLEIYESVTKG